MSTGLTVAGYDKGWSEWPDFVRYHPGARHRRRLTLKMLEGIEATSILDVGCGSGDLLRLLAHGRAGARLAGADLSPAVLLENTRRVSGVEFHQLDIATDRLDVRFDMITCCEVIEHIEDRSSAIGNLASMLNTGGYLLITCPTGPVHDTERRFGHVGEHPTISEVRTYANQAGLVLVKALNWGWPTYRLLKWGTNVNPQWAIDTFAVGDYGLLQRAFSTVLYWANFLNVGSDAGCQLFVLLRRR